MLECFIGAVIFIYFKFLAQCTKIRSRTDDRERLSPAVGAV